MKFLSSLRKTFSHKSENEFLISLCVMKLKKNMKTGISIDVPLPRPPPPGST